MMNNVFCTGGSIVNNWGTNLDNHWTNVLNKDSSLLPMTLNDGTQTYASYLSAEQWQQLFEKYGTHYTKSALLCIEAINCAIKNQQINWKKTAIIVATTKGDIDLYAFDKPNIHNIKTFFHHLSSQLNTHFKPIRPCTILSNACISGSQAIQLGAAYLQSGIADNVVVCGVDLCTTFTLTGFNSLKALSSQPAMPFDKNRDGISLGEASSALVLSKEALPFNGLTQIQYVTGAVSNDANHISGPSRTGEGLYQAIQHVSSQSEYPIDAISLHGTATIYNDDMESVAIHRCGLQSTPCFGLKGIYGHTLGAAGILESIISLLALSYNIIPATTGYTNLGTAHPIAVSSHNQKGTFKTILKCTSGFGGGNCALIFHKN